MFAKPSKTDFVFQPVIHIKKKKLIPDFRLEMRNKMREKRLAAHLPVFGGPVPEAVYTCRKKRLKKERTSTVS